MQKSFCAPCVFFRGFLRFPFECRGYEHVPSIYTQYFNHILLKSKMILISSVNNIFKVGMVIALMSALLMAFLKEAQIQKNKSE
jgi:hypothetical protein